ncbi:MAG: catalase [Gammaproteobacteria bacterium]
MTSQMTIEQIVAEMNDCIDAIASMEKDGDHIPRLNQVKSVACVDATFEVHEDIPDELRKGLFAKPACYPAKLRFANATSLDDSEKDIRGLSIRVADVEGKVLWGEPGYQDFLLNSYPALFVATPEEFLGFIRARLNNRKLWFFLNPFEPHLKSLWIVFKSRKHHLCPFDVRYWSTVPFRMGVDSDLAVKYSLIPCSDYRTEQLVEPGRHQFRAAMKAHLKNQPARFQFALQKQDDPRFMPIEDASVIWDEAISPFQTVATITIDDQDFENSTALSACESSGFNPWQCLPDHEPLGRMNEVRRLVYAHAAAMRSQLQ